MDSCSWNMPLIIYWSWFDHNRTIVHEHSRALPPVEYAEHSHEHKDEFEPSINHLVIMDTVY
eukprot:214539-Lingulodinium_polyedra.AAC.1